MEISQFNFFVHGRSLLCEFILLSAQCSDYFSRYTFRYYNFSLYVYVFFFLYWIGRYGGVHFGGKLWREAFWIDKLPWQHQCSHLFFIMFKTMHLSLCCPSLKENDLKGNLIMGPLSSTVTYSCEKGMIVDQQFACKKKKQMVYFLNARQNSFNALYTSINNRKKTPCATTNISCDIWE